MSARPPTRKITPASKKSPPKKRVVKRKVQKKVTPKVVKKVSTKRAERSPVRSTTGRTAISPGRRGERPARIRAVEVGVRPGTTPSSAPTRRSPSPTPRQKSPSPSRRSPSPRRSPVRSPLSSSQQTEFLDSFRKDRRMKFFGENKLSFRGKYTENGKAVTLIFARDFDGEEPTLESLRELFASGNYEVIENDTRYYEKSKPNTKFLAKI